MSIVYVCKLKTTCLGATKSSHVRRHSKVYLDKERRVWNLGAGSKYATSHTVCDRGLGLIRGQASHSYVYTVPLLITIIIIIIIWTRNVFHKNHLLLLNFMAAGGSSPRAPRDPYLGPRPRRRRLSPRPIIIKMITASIETWFGTPPLYCQRYYTSHSWASWIRVRVRRDREVSSEGTRRAIWCAERCWCGSKGAEL